MPITPFHFGPGVCLKSFGSKRVSLTTFVAANVLIDIEPVLGYLLIDDPIHGYAHTLAGATLLALLCGWFGRPLCEALLRFWNSRLSPAQAEWMGTDPVIPMKAAVGGALAGTWSHLLLDGIMHIDIRPLWPLSPENPFLQFISLGSLHVLCVSFGLWGVLRLTTQRWDAVRNQRRADNGISRLDHLDAVTIRFLVGLLRGFVGVSALFMLVAMPIQQSLEASMTGDSFDSTRWKAAATLKFSDENPRLPMIRDLERYLMNKRPSREKVIELLGPPLGAPDREEINYPIGKPNSWTGMYLLIVSFDTDDHVASVRIYRD